MGFLIAILTLVLVGLVLAVVGAPLRRARRLGPGSGATDAHPHAGGAPASPAAGTRAELEAAREAKYREIRDTELDYRTGKLSREDYQSIDADLRAEALEILEGLEDLRPRDA